ncbi:MAG: hypothetical protein A2096_06070 [Spirochaetes bacterium GWF1_41_5]|nr:MAG: hypothetical protein A2096_06070 [Spirochaetes bacterium GWF1_41_5]HBE04363.1 DUF4914 domain-containing protein [Spirochaetia bacterium]
MHEHLHREYDGTITFGENTASGEKRSLVFSRTCDIRPVADDMALCHPNFQKNNGKLTAFDAESAWFIRVDHIKNYGTDPDIEARSIHPPEPIVFLNIDAQPGSSALLWEHTEDSPGKACPNPRFIFPRHTVPGIVEKPVSIDLRSFGLRTPPSSRENPDYGILGIFHVLPPAVAWLWRLVSPRGYQNPSVLESGSMESEGVGSYWPFATGKKTRQASLLLAQFESSPRVHYVLCPNQHIGIWKTGFMPQWIMREYLARRGGVKFSREELSPARCLLLGYALNKLMVEGQIFDKHFLKTECQPEMGTEAYDQGAEILFSFFRRELADFNNPDLCSSGRKIIECFFDHGKLEQMDSLLPGESIFLDE